MEKTYQEQAIAFILKAVVGLGSVYLITEKFIGQIDHLFHLESIRTAVVIFYLIYFVSPVAVVCAYFSLKKGSMQLFNRRANLVMALLALVYLGFLTLVFYLPVTPSLYVGGGLIAVSIGFIYFCMGQRMQPEYKKEMFQYVSIAFIIILFAASYLIRNDRTATRFEGKYFSNLDGHFQAMDSVDNYLNSVQNKFQFEKEDTLESTMLKKYFKETGAGDTIQYATDAELIRISRNRWGLFINLISYKALLVLLPFAAVVVGFIFLLTTSQPKTTEPTLLKKQGDDYEVKAPHVHPIPEKEFLKLAFIVLITIILPVLHPLETIKSTFTKPVSFTEPVKPVDPPPVVLPPYQPPPDTISKPGPGQLQGTKINLEGYGEVIVLSPVSVDMRKFVASQTDFEMLKNGLKNVNSNLVLFSQRFAPEVASQQVKGPVFYYPSPSKLEANVFKK